MKYYDLELIDGTLLSIEVSAYHGAMLNTLFNTYGTKLGWASLVEHGVLPDK